MHPIVRNILAVLLGLIVGSVVNMLIVMSGGAIIPPPEGADVSTMESLKASLHLFEPQHFIMPFLAHALGTFAGALTAALIAASHKMIFAFIIGGFFLLGGIANTFMLPSPIVFTIIDLSCAYIPMGYFAGNLAAKKK